MFRAIIVMGLPMALTGYGIYFGLLFLWANGSVLLNVCSFIVGMSAMITVAAIINFITFGDWDFF